MGEQPNIRRLRLAAVAAGPVIYQAPLYRALAADGRIDLTVYFASSGGVRPYDAAFGGRPVVWDVDLLGGYRSEFLRAADGNDVLGGFFALRDLDVIRRIAGGAYDAVWVHGYSYLTIWLAMTTAWLCRRPVLLREEQTLLHDRPWPKRWARDLVLRALLRRVYGLYIGSSNRAYFRRYGVPEHRLFFAPYCVDNDFFRQEAMRLASRKGELRASFGIEPDAGPLVLFVGKLTAKKEPLLALGAFARVRSSQRCSLLFVGEGELEATLRRRVEAESVPDVHFSGFLNRSEISRAYAAADLLVLPSSLHETWGLVVNEAMNFSLPVIVSDKVGCAPDLVRDGKNGYVVPSRDAEALATAIGSLVADPERRCSFGTRSRQIVDGWHYRVAVEGIIDACRAADHA